MAMRGDASPNHEFVLRSARRLAANDKAAILDFGCGQGHFVCLAREAGFDCLGADAYPGNWQSWGEGVYEAARPFVSAIVDGRLPYADEQFDVVVSNMVFEHIPPDELEHSLREIRRVLKPGGRFLSLFSTRDTWFEGHIGLYFPHRLQRWPRVQLAYLRACYQLGLGYDREQSTDALQWAKLRRESIGTYIHLHTARTMQGLWIKAFGANPVSLAPDYMRFRLGLDDRLRNRLVDALLEFVCHRRAGHILLSRKAPGTAMPATQ
jgi:SAM-dependent methyltransferase